MGSGGETTERLQYVHCVRFIALDEFAQLQANISVPSTQKVGKAKRCCLVEEVY